MKCRFLSVFLAILMVVCMLCGCASKTDEQQERLEQERLEQERLEQERLEHEMYLQEMLEQEEMFEQEMAEKMGYDYVPEDNPPAFLEDTSGLECLDLIPSIDRNSIKSAAGNLVYFTANMPDGSTLRFEGKNIEITEDTIVFNPSAYLCALDSIGQLHGWDVQYVWPNGENDYQYLCSGYAYTFNDSVRSVASADELHKDDIHQVAGSGVEWDGPSMDQLYLPNFPYISTYDWVACEAKELLFYYDPSVKTTQVKKLWLDTDFYPFYVEGEAYDASREQMADSENGLFTFYLNVLPDSDYLKSTYGDIYRIAFLDKGFFTVGDLKDASGNVLDKATAKMSIGCTLDVTVGDRTFAVELPVVAMSDGEGVENNHARIPGVYPDATGAMKTLVIPLTWADQQDKADVQTVYPMVGRVMDEGGNITDYSDYTDGKTSLSEYYDAASYGKLEITSFVTDIYCIKSALYSEHRDGLQLRYYEANDVLEQLYLSHPDMDWSQFDRDGNGYYDSVVFIGLGDMDLDYYSTISFGGAYNNSFTNGTDHAGRADLPRINNFTYVCLELLEEDYNTLHHEFAHGLGLIDYYDVTYSGIDAVGSFDMQSGSIGDWNCYSKISVGWIDPMVVEGLASGESVEYTIGSSALQGDAIVIPAAGKQYNGPFGEYLMIDLFTDDGVNGYDAADAADIGADLTDAAGVRISHVNAQMEVHPETKTSAIAGMDPTPISYDVLTPHYVNSYNEAGKYHIEVIQAGGKNTLTVKSETNNHRFLTKQDLFYAGDRFTMAGYNAFFADGRMDDGSEFGYEIEIVSIEKNADGEDQATVRITRQ